jgi:uncharacterized membrane protein
MRAGAAQRPPSATRTEGASRWRCCVDSRAFLATPSHPPLTGVSIGAYTIAVALLVLGALGLEEPAMAHGALLAATAAFALSWFPARAGDQAGRVHAAALILALAGEALLFAGGYLGGTLVYVLGHRVLAQPQTPVGEALRPGRVSPRPQPAESAPLGSRRPPAPREGP